jgi:single-stranded DNA-specific DHH superfamily exonuclease
MDSTKGNSELETINEELETINEELEAINEKRKEIKDDARKNSETLSERTRVISLAIIGLSWTFILANLTSNTSAGAGLIETKKLLIPILFSALALAFDFLQYLLNQFLLDNLRKKIASKKPSGELHYEDYMLKNSNPILLGGPIIVFWLKIISMIIAIIEFIWIVLVVIQ